MGAQTDRLRCEIFQNLFLSPINTALLRHAVATALTVYGIETLNNGTGFASGFVATALTVYGIETSIFALCQEIKLFRCNSPYRLRY